MIYIRNLVSEVLCALIIYSSMAFFKHKQGLRSESYLFRKA